MSARKENTVQQSHSIPRPGGGMRGHGGRGGPVVKPKNFKGTLKDFGITLETSEKFYPSFSYSY